MKLTTSNNDTKIFTRMLAVLTVSFLFLSFGSTASASMEPAEIREINDQAPYHLIGTVTEDKLIQQLSVSKKSPSQLRMMTIELMELNRAPTNEPLRTIEATYTYSPPWVSRDGGKGMDIAVGDVIEVWLDEGEFGLEPAIGGDSVQHVFYVKERPIHIREPITSKALHVTESFLQNPHTVGNSVVITGLLILSALLAFLGRRKLKHN
ncbi:hypothetical protein ACFOZY_06815 [Chungangia koreensis]|uniref:LPXTG-motif cell wall anchor domain-containing protein n=1 Tax=Chungangia koreensis TaxID=752657 RepID=A0ABV8X7S2_9LACT